MTLSLTRPSSQRALVDALKRQWLSGVFKLVRRARGYFVCSSGNIPDKTIAQYIQLQGAEPQDDDRFRIRED